MTLLFRYWREALIVVMVVACITLFNRHERMVEERGAALERARAADSALAATLPLVKTQSAAVVHDTQTVLRILHKLDSVPVFKRDTFYIATDTGHAHPLVPLPASEVTTLDSLAPACRALVQDCAAFRTTAEQRFAEYERRIAAFGSVPVAPTGRLSTRDVLLGAVAGALFEHYRPHH